MKKRVLITGGAGFVGSTLAKMLIGGQDTGDFLAVGEEATSDLQEISKNLPKVELPEVVILDDMSSGRLDNINGLLKNDNFKFIAGDVNNRDACFRAARGCDQIYHLAAIVGIKKVMAEPIVCAKTSVIGTENIMNAAVVNGCRRVFIASSSQVYGPHPGLCRESDYISIAGSPVWIYALAKSMEEFIGVEFARKKGINLTIGRFFNLAGPHQTKPGGHVLPNLISAAENKKLLPIFGDGEQKRSFMKVSDAICAIMALMENPDATGVYNIGSSMDPISILELGKIVNRLAGNKKDALQFIPYGQAYGNPDYVDVQARKPSISKLKKMIDFEVESDIEEIVKYCMGI